jgi:hypothetical protein
MKFKRRIRTILLGEQRLHKFASADAERNFHSAAFLNTRYTEEPAMASPEIDKVLEKLAKDVEAAVHAMYRGEVRQGTAKARTDGFVREAHASLKSAVEQAASSAPPPMPSPRPSVAAPVVAGAAVGWSKEEGEAVLKCITAWLPMGPPNTADPNSKCIAAAREITPTWDQRQKAHAAVKRLSSI